MRISLFLVLLMAISCQTQVDKISYEHPIPFAPRNYVCFKTAEKIIIDGKDEESTWKQAKWTDSFVDIQGHFQSLPNLDTKVKMLWDEDYFYFFAKLVEPHIWGTLKNRDDIIYHDDDFEIFIDPDGDGHNYYEIEVNALNTIWDLILLKPYRADDSPKVLFEWNVTNMKSAIHIQGSLNDPSDEDEFWTLEIAIPWFSLKELAEKIPEHNDQWRVNFSRVDWTVEAKNGVYQKTLDESTKKPLPEKNWVWSPTGEINMHMPEMWGFVQFSDQYVSTGSDAFIENEDEEIKWALWNLFWQQKRYFETHGEYSSSLENFTIPKLEKCELNPSITVTPFSFYISADSCQNSGKWVIRSDGKIFLQEN